MHKKLFFILIVVLIGSSSLAFGMAAPEESSEQQETESKQASGPEFSTGPNNAITDVSGIEVGHYDKNYTGTTVILARGGAVGAVEVRGSAPGTRETDLLDPINLVDQVNAIVLSGGSAYGLAAADGVMLWLEEQGIGWPVGGGNLVPIVPSAILFDPGRFGREFSDRPTAEFGRKAAENLAEGPVDQGNVGAGAGAISGGMKGGIGTASIDLGNGVIVGAIAAINSGGSTIDPNTGLPYASFLEIGDEFGDLKETVAAKGTGEQIALAGSEPVKNTTIAVVATNVKLTKTQARKIAEMAHDGMARAIRPAHTMFDGDTVFVLGTGELSPEVLKQEAAWGYMPANINKIGSAAADTLSRAIVHGILNAQTVGEVKSYLDAYPNVK
ncbi:MAG: P1 family peptidase [Spirochaetales bacterium]|nr:P1 family peptidase [Spirochaetales bacterium]MCF7939475.1 P1 family peptidase [Spirochaetales bacterium]